MGPFGVPRILPLCGPQGVARVGAHMFAPLCAPKLCHLLWSPGVPQLWRPVGTRWIQPVPNSSHFNLNLSALPPNWVLGVPPNVKSNVNFGAKMSLVTGQGKSDNHPNNALESNMSTLNT